MLRKPGAATITEMIAALLEVFMGNFMDLSFLLAVLYRGSEQKPALH